MGDAGLDDDTGSAESAAAAGAETDREADAEADRDTGARGAGVLDSVLSALAQARPAVTDHVVRAGQELAAAAQAIVDALSGAVPDATSGTSSETGPAPGDPVPAPDAATPDPATSNDAPSSDDHG